MEQLHRLRSPPLWFSRPLMCRCIRLDWHSFYLHLYAGLYKKLTMSGQLRRKYFSVCTVYPVGCAKVNCGKAAREGALGCDLGTPFVNSSAPAEPQGRTHPPQWASSEQPPQAALSESECSPTSRMILRCPGAHCAPLRDNVASGNISFNSLYRLISLSNNLFFLRIWRVPAVIGWCSPITALLHACRPVRWWIRFAAAKPRRLKRAPARF